MSGSLRRLALDFPYRILLSVQLCNALFRASTTFIFVECCLHIWHLTATNLSVLCLFCLLLAVFLSWYPMALTCLISWAVKGNFTTFFFNFSRVHTTYYGLFQRSLDHFSRSVLCSTLGYIHHFIAALLTDHHTILASPIHCDLFSTSASPIASHRHSYLTFFS